MYTWSGFHLSVTLSDWFKKKVHATLSSNQKSSQPIVTRSHAFTRAYWQLHVSALSFDWCNGLTVCVICEWSERLQSLWFCFTTLNRPSSIYQCSIIDQRLSAQNCNFFKFNFLCLSIPKRDIKGYKENATKHIYRTWSIEHCSMINYIHFSV